MSYTLRAPILIKQYNYRYLEDKRKVFFITKKQEYLNSHNKNIYSVPFVNEHTGEIRNALLGHTSPSSCLSLVIGLNKVTHGKEISNENKDMFIMEYTDIHEYKYLSEIVFMPLIVIVNSCQIDNTQQYEVFYYFNQKKFPKFKKLK
jgi:hypothetical protein